MTLHRRSRRQTRAALLGYLLTSGDCFRGELVERLGLTEASISRIIAELKAENLVTEYARRPAPYPGGPTKLVAINRSIRLAVVELSNGRVSAGIGTLAGLMEYSHRVVLASNSDSIEVLRAVETALKALGSWAGKNGIAVRQVGLSLPGFGALGDINAIIPAGVENLSNLVREQFPSVPVSVTNSVQAQAAMHGFGLHAKADTLDLEHLFVFVGHGIGAARISQMAKGAPHRPVEIGHMVMQSNGPRCRCGHFGCLEAYAALPALATALEVSEAQLLADGDSLFQIRKLSERNWPSVRDMLWLIGQAIGNSINVDPVADVVLAGWPSLLTIEQRGVLIDGLDSSVLGGAARRGIKVTFIPPLIGNDPMPTLCYAAYAFVQRGAIDTIGSSDTDVALIEHQDAVA